MRALSVGVIGLGLLAGSVALCSSSGARPLPPQESGGEAEAARGDGPGPVPRQVIKNEELMKFFFDPYYIDLRRALREPPQERRDWRAVYVAAHRLAEATNLLYFREGKDYMETEAWDQKVAEALRIAARLCETVKTLDYEQVKPEYERLIESCNDCHTTFEPKDPTEVQMW